MSARGWRALNQAAISAGVNQNQRVLAVAPCAAVQIGSTAAAGNGRAPAGSAGTDGTDGTLFSISFAGAGSGTGAACTQLTGVCPASSRAATSPRVVAQTGSARAVSREHQASVSGRR